MSGLQIWRQEDANWPSAFQFGQVSSASSAQNKKDILSDVFFGGRGGT